MIKSNEQVQSPIRKILTVFRFKNIEIKRELYSRVIHIQETHEFQSIKARGLSLFGNRACV